MKEAERGDLSKGGVGGQAVPVGRRQEVISRESTNFREKLLTPEESHQRGVLGTALCLLSLTQASIKTSVLYKYKRWHVKESTKAMPQP